MSMWDPIYEKIARAIVVEFGGDPDEIVTRGLSPNQWTGARWKLEVEWVRRHVIAHRILKSEA